jgi:hypothetical protein
LKTRSDIVEVHGNDSMSSIIVEHIKSLASVEFSFYGENFVERMTYVTLTVINKLEKLNNNILGFQIKGVRDDAVNLIVFFEGSPTYTYRTFDARVDGSVIEFGKNKATIYSREGKKDIIQGTHAHHNARQICDIANVTNTPLPGERHAVNTTVLEKMYRKDQIEEYEEEFNRYFAYQLCDSNLYRYAMSLLELLELFWRDGALLLNLPEMDLPVLGLGLGMCLRVRPLRVNIDKIIEDASLDLTYVAVTDHDLLYHIAVLEDILLFHNRVLLFFLTVYAAVVNV